MGEKSVNKNQERNKIGFVTRSEKGHFTLAILDIALILSM